MTAGPDQTVFKIGFYRVALDQVKMTSEGVDIMAREGAALKAAQDEIKNIGAALTEDVLAEFSQDERAILRQLQTNPQEFNAKSAQQYIDIQNPKAATFAQRLIQQSQICLSAAYEMGVNVRYEYSNAQSNRAREDQKAIDALRKEHADRIERFEKELAELRLDKKKNKKEIDVTKNALKSEHESFAQRRGYYDMDTARVVAKKLQDFHSYTIRYLNHAYRAPLALMKEAELGRVAREMTAAQGQSQTLDKAAAPTKAGAVLAGLSGQKPVGA